MVPENLIVTCNSCYLIDMILHWDVYIVDLATLYAPDVIMGTDSGIKTFLGTGYLKF